ncbi:SecY-interacting protein [Alteromonadaceae bacterium BrNp21-10]|nr:SecY-interacting protein [Alteromonadaceae bacterium BrNp21-10]
MQENLNLCHVLDEFMQTLQAALTESLEYPDNALLTEFDEQWPSPCVISTDNNDDQSCWLPVRKTKTTAFDNLEQAVKLTLHPDIKAFYSRYYSDPLNANSSRGALQLLQVWNDDDFERLQTNLIGHILMKQRLRQPVTLFFALTDEDDFILSVDNASGEVLLEQVGQKAREVLSPNLATFIQSLQPLI